jgi:protein-S-isoprenylcysteine O-methyltransferase Ste14
MNHPMLLALVSSVWVASEVIVGVITRRSAAEAARHDRGSLILLWALLGATIFAAAQLQFLKIGRMPERNTLFWVGLALILIGILIRGVAILTLRRFFTVSVMIQESHELIERGIYKVVRHPSYTGSLVSFVGLGFAFGNWLSLGLVVIGASIGFAYRIRVEETALTNHFGDRYRSYAARTKRLIPGVY